jgi:hypothetical protein
MYCVLPVKTIQAEGASGIAPAFGLSPEMVAVRDEARDFAVRLLRPRAAELEWESDPRAVLIDQCLKVQRILARYAKGRARELFLNRFVRDPRCLLAICFTDPETGSDYIIDATPFCFRTRAEQRQTVAGS